MGIGCLFYGLIFAFSEDIYGSAGSFFGYLFSSGGFFVYVWIICSKLG
jgi:hypothetical protein